MAISEYVGDMFTSTSTVFGHGVNCEKNMNSGLAAYIRVTYPEVYEEFLTKDFVGGDIQPVETNDGKIILNIASQIKSGANARIDLLVEGVHNALSWVEQSEHDTLALPRIGCGIGGLEWDFVRQTIIDMSAEYPTVNVELWSIPE